MSPVVADPPQPGQPLDCGHPCPTPPEGAGTSGWGMWQPEGQPEVRACFPCMDTLAKLEMAQAHKAGRPFGGAYLNTEGDKLTTCTGATVANVLWRTGAGNSWAPDLLRVGARDLAGRLWTGTARRGMYARLRPLKGKAARANGGA